jgi:hypothetical protein
VSARAPAHAASAERDWWLRTLLVLQRPKPVFVALRDDSREATSDRAEPILLIVILAGIAGVLATSVAGSLMDPSSSLDGSTYDPLMTAIWAFIVGGLYGALSYFALGAILHVAVTALGSEGSFRRTRHIVAFAATPIALSLLVWPVKLAVFGESLFRSGGSDSGSGGEAFAVIWLAFVAWAAALLVIGVRAVHGWTWARAGAACALAIAMPIVVSLLFRL